ncbi:MAG TPA: folylpolyglutamate synthase/dihydrofolate synthase family protein [Vicinamibacteria bacterium]
MTPRAAFAYLEERTQLGIKFGLETIRAVVEELGHPERTAPSILVAGTNGKGSVCAMLESALRASGLRTGLYTSPHLLRVNERVAIGGRAVSDRDLARALGAVRDAAEGLVARGRIPAHPTYFETVTAAAFWRFREARVQVMVLEVGLGGRLDATNVSDPLVSAIVSLDFDHEAFLGRTLSAIAREKAGVMRKGRAVVLGPLPREARHAIALEARRVGARLVDARGERGAVPWPRRLPLAGEHQRDNLRVALRVLDEAGAAGLPLDRARAARGISRARWRGRLQLLPGRPPLLLDGAHNPAGARALGLYLRGAGPFVLVFGVMADKDVPGLARELFPLARAVVLTRPRVGRAALPASIARATRGLAGRPHQEADVRKALALARRLARPGDTVVVAGSLYLVGEVLALRRPRKWSRASGRSHSATPR